MVGNQFIYKKENGHYKLYCFTGKNWQQNNILLRHFFSNDLYELLKDLLINVYWHKYALFKILTEYHRKFCIDNNSTFIMPTTILNRTQNYLENSCDLVAWFKFEYRQDEKDEEVSYIKVNDIYQHFITSDAYVSLNKTEKQKYQKLKFFETMRNNIFFYQYYVERYEGIRHFIKG